jgi:hypothetical protein
VAERVSVSGAHPVARVHRIEAWMDRCCLSKQSRAEKRTEHGAALMIVVGVLRHVANNAPQ